MKLTVFKDLFRGRMDAYGAGKGQCVKQQLTDSLLLSHLSGKGTRIGMYPLSPDIENGTASWWIAIDFDDGCLSTAKKAYATLDALGIQADIEVSKSKGYHVWVFCSEPIFAAELRMVVTFAMQQAGITDYELFPKQDALTQGTNGNWNFGNYINLPMYGQDVKNGRTTFLDHTDSFMPILDGRIWTFLQDVKRLNKTVIDDIIANQSLKPPSTRCDAQATPSANTVTTSKTPAQPKTQSLGLRLGLSAKRRRVECRRRTETIETTKRIETTARQQQTKATQPAINIVSQKVEGQMNALEILDFFGIELPSSRIHNDELIACCPFHNENTPSFSLNIPGCYYHCFGCDAKGYITELVEHLTKITIDQIKEALKGKVPEGVKVNIPGKKQARYMTEKEIDLLTWYITGLNVILLDRFGFTEGDILKQRPDVSIFRDYIIKERGISEAAIEEFKLGANVHAIMNDGKPRREQYWYWEQFTLEVVRHLFYQYSDVEATLKELNLINARKNDYWFRPAIIIPYLYDGQAYWAEARTLPQYVDPKVPIRYMGMKGIIRECFWNEGALDEYDEVYVVEGAINGITLWCHDIKNVVSFGSKNQLTDELINRLLGKQVILYVDADKRDPDKKSLSEAIGKLQEVAPAISYLDFPAGEDINDLHIKVSHDIFMTEIEARTVDVVEENDWLPHEVRERQDKEDVISLALAQQKNRELLTEIGGNLQNYIGKKILNNMPIGTGKTTSTAEGMNRAPRVPKLVALGQHNLANEYIERLDTDSIIHLFGRTHKVVDCQYKEEAEILCNKGYSVYFKLNYCLSKCEKASNCIHLENSKKAKWAEVLITMHSHIELMDFLLSDYYGNNLRQMVVIDEAPKLVRDIYFERQDIIDNLAKFRELTNKLIGKGLLFAEHAIVAEYLVKVLEGMDKALSERDEYSPRFDIPHLPVFDRQFINTINRMVRVDLSASRIPRFILNELTYALKKGLRFRYDGAYNALFYTWRPVFSQRACTIFLSATTDKEYLENQLGEKVDIVLGEQFYVNRENLRVVQLMNLSGSRQRLMNTTRGLMSQGDFIYRENLRLTLKLLLKKYPEHKIVIATSLGGKTEKRDYGWAKERIINMLRDVADECGKTLVPVTVEDLENERQFTIDEIPVLHFGMLGTNLLKDFQILLEINAHYYSPDVIIEHFKTEFGVELRKDRFVKQQRVFKTIDKEYEVKGWTYDDKKYPELTEEVNLYIQNNSQADMEQLEGRILRGEDTFKSIIRLHNVNIKPYPNAVYKSWQTMFKKEFGYAELKGKAKQVYEWLVANASVGEFTVKELVAALGGYRQNHLRILQQLEAMGYIKITKKGQRGGSETAWMLA